MNNIYFSVCFFILLFQKLCYNIDGDKMQTWIEYIISAIFLIIISWVIVILTKRDFNIEANKLITYLGGKDNIINAECNMSRLKVILKDVSLANKEGIQKLGAKGIVEIDNQLKIIFDKNAKQLKKYIEEIL